MDKQNIIDSLKKGLFLENQLTGAVWAYSNKKISFYNMGSWNEVDWYQSIEDFANRVVINYRACEWEIKEKVGAMMKKFYLGDGVYLETDGIEVVLTTEDGISVSNRIFINTTMISLMLSNINEVLKGDK